MVKVLNLIFGSVLAIIGLNSLIGFFTEPSYMFFIIGGIGVIIMFVPVSGGRFFKFVRRWIFGGFLVLSALLSFFSGSIPILDSITYGSWVAGLIILFIGAIYFLSAFAKTREFNIDTV